MHAVLSLEPDNIDSAPIEAESAHSEADNAASKQANALTSPLCPYNCPRSLNIVLLKKPKLMQIKK